MKLVSNLVTRGFLVAARKTSTASPFSILQTWLKKEKRTFGVDLNSFGIERIAVTTLNSRLLPPSGRLKIVIFLFVVFHVKTRIVTF